MGKYYISFSILIFSILFLFASCAEENESDMYLLPVKIQAEDVNSSSVFTYSYDNYQRLLEVVEKRSAWSDVVEDSEIRYTINYNMVGKISSLIRNSLTVVNNSSTTRLTDTVYFEYEGLQVQIKDSFGGGIVVLNDSNQVVSCELFTDKNSKDPEVYTFEYDAYGNMSKYTSKDGVEIYAYSYDHNNGIFQHVNTPQWFMVVMLHEKNNLKNNYINQTLLKNSADGARYGIRYQYNMEGYPIAQRDVRESVDELAESFTPHTTIAYKGVY